MINSPGPCGAPRSACVGFDPTLMRFLVGKKKRHLCTERQNDRTTERQKHSQKEKKKSWVLRDHRTPVLVLMGENNDRSQVPPRWHTRRRGLRKTGTWASIPSPRTSFKGPLCLANIFPQICGQFAGLPPSRPPAGGPLAIRRGFFFSLLPLPFSPAC